MTTLLTKNIPFHKLATLLLCFLMVNTALGKDSKKKKKAKIYPPQIECSEIITYKTTEQAKLNLYLFNPDGHSSKESRPAILFFFGGGWRNGSPKQFEKQCEYFASRGMVAITADYRVSTRHGTKAIQCVADAKSAVRYVRKNAAKLGIDPDRIVASGGSAGGHIAACTGVVDGMEETGEDTTVSSKPSAMVLFNPALAIAPIDGEHPLGKRAAGMKERVGDDPQKISPYHHIKKDQPPTIIFFGTDDRLLKGAEQFTKASKAAGNRCELMTWEGLSHGFFNYRKNKNKPFVETVTAADKFLASLGYIKGEPTVK